MKWVRRRIVNRPADSVPRDKVITLAHMLEVSRTDPSDGRQGRGPAGGYQPIGGSYQEGRPAQESALPPWAEPATRCLNAYIRLDYSACTTAGREALSLQLIPTVGLVTLLAMRRQGRLAEAEGLSRALLRCGVGPGGWLYLLLMLLDGALDPERFLKERFFAGFRVGVNQELECQVYFYWGAKLLTEGKFTDAIKPLLLCVRTECDALERTLAKADLATAQALDKKAN
jgi:hypothetical protein